MIIKLPRMNITEIDTRAFVESGESIKNLSCYFYFVNFHSISFGLHVDIKNFFIELHVPFGFIHIGLVDALVNINKENTKHSIKRIYGYKPEPQYIKILEQ